MVIPQGMAYAMIAGLPPIHGLYAALVPSITYSILGTSRKVSIGPVALDSLMVFACLSSMATAGSDSYIALAMILAILVGMTQLIMGLFKLGFLVNFLSKPVISGFTSAAALVIGFSQLKHLFGITISEGQSFPQLLIELLRKSDQINSISLIIGLVGIAALVILKKINPKIPGALLLVIGGILVAYFVDLSALNVNLVGELPMGFPQFSVPNFSLQTASDLFLSAFAIAMIGFMEATSVEKSIEDNRENTSYDPNQELRALGSANILGSFFQGFPVSAGLSRSAINVQAGARSPLTGIISAIVVALSLLFLTDVFYYLPKTLLASIILVAIYSLLDIKYPKRLWKNRKEEFALLIITFAATLGLGITAGILIGIALSLLLLIHRTTQPHLAVLGKIKGKELFKNVERFPDHELYPHILIVRFDSQLYFANANHFKESLNQLVNEKGEGLQLLILSAEGINFIDSSAAHMLRKTITRLQKQGIQIKITNTIGPVRDIFKKSEIRDLVGLDNFHLDIPEAIKAFEKGGGTDHASIVLQTNL